MGLNWVDLFMACIIAGILYIGRENDFFSEVFKLIGVYFATIIAIHYYVPVGRFVAVKWLVPNIIQEVFAFVLLSLLVITLFHFVREGWMILLKVEGLAFLDHWGKWVLTVVRVYLICGLTFLALLMTGHRAIAYKARSSLSSKLFLYTSIYLYKSFFLDFVYKVLPDEPLNEKVLELLPAEEN